MFHLIVGFLNALGWFLWYVLAGGWAADVPLARLSTIGVFLVPSAVATIGSYFLKTGTYNPFSNIWRILEFSIFFSAPIINLFWGNAEPISRFTGFLACGVLYCINFCGKMKPAPFLVKMVVTAFFICITKPFLGNQVLQDMILVPGFLVALPLSVILGIKNTFAE